MAIILPSGSNINDTKRIAILWAAGSRFTIKAADKDDVIVTERTYEKIPSIHRQFDTRNYGQMVSTIEKYVVKTANFTNRNLKRGKTDGQNSSNNSRYLNHTSGQTRKG